MEEAEKKTNVEVASNTSNEELMKQLVDLQKQVVEQQKKSLDGVNEKRVNKYAVLLFIYAGFFLLWFFGSIVALTSRWSGGEFLIHDHIIMPIMSTMMIVAGVQLMSKKRQAKISVGVAMGIAGLWNMVASIHGYIVDTTQTSYAWYTRDASSAMVLAIVRLVIGLLAVGGMALWFYKSRSIQEEINRWP